MNQKEHNYYTSQLRPSKVWIIHVGKLDKTGYQIIRGFKALTLSDEEAAIALVDQFQKSDLRSFALIGMLSGLKELLSKAETRSAQ
jgi:hypothetical protein